MIRKRIEHTIEAVLLLLLMFSLAAYAQDEPHTGVIQGVVVSRSTEQPLRGVRVYLDSAPDRLQVQVTTTNDAGEFEFNVPEGKYGLRVTEVPTPSSPVFVTVSPNSTSRGIKVEMTFTSSISGRVVDENNKPFVN